MLEQHILIEQNQDTQPFDSPIVDISPGSPIVIVGNGPVGMHAARELLRRQPEAQIIIYGKEQHQPYNRVKLSYLLSGETDWNALLEKLEIPETAAVKELIGYSISKINSKDKFVEDMQGRRQTYHKLILATGSRAHIPNIPGINRKGVFTFRNLDDANLLLARRVRTQKTVVLGGGLLGLEAARGMQRSNTEVTVVEHADRLLSNQLDEAASNELCSRLEGLGIRTVIGDGVSEILGEPSVTGIKLRSGNVLQCDTVVVATGIRPNIDLAVETGIAFGKGIRVNDNMETSIPNIYAVGECAEHRGKVYGVVAPGLEQAGVAISHITGQKSQYQGSVISARLKVIGCHVFSAGPVGATASPNYGKCYVYQNVEEGTYRKLLIHRNRLIGAIGIGEWSETPRMQNSIAEKKLIWPWQVFGFTRTGYLWPEETVRVQDWPATAAVCQCTGATRGSIGKVIRSGATSVTEISQATGAASVCGSCRPLVQELIGANEPEPAPWHKTLSVSAIVTLVAILAVLISPVILYAQSVQVEWRWDELWRNSFFKQISGFTILSLFIIGLFVSPRKRIKSLKNFGNFDGWRFLHIAIGLLVIVGLVVHTGMRLGHGLNFFLMLTFSATVILGSIATAVIAQEHRIGSSATWIRRKAVWWHILLFWPVPVTLSFHILNSYYF